MPDILELYRAHVSMNEVALACQLPEKMTLLLVLLVSTLHIGSYGDLS